jgi:FKBP-type peptidyl-prolyl cis-trans isomerase FkpA
MLKNVFATAAIAGVVLLSSCKEYKTNENGLRYKILADSTGPVGEEGGEALIHFQITNHQDSLLESTFKRNSPMPIQIKSGEFKGGLVEGLMLLSKGDSAVFLISADSIFKKQPTLPPGVFKGKDLKFTVKVVSLLGKAEIAKERSKMEKEFETRKQEMEGQLGKDTLVIIDHLKTKKIKYKKNQGGVYYSITKAGNGKKLAMNDSIKVNYVGKFLDGKEFDSGKDFPIVLGVSQVIYGWHMGLSELSRGDKATLYIPSPLGYGAQGAGTIPPNTILVFDIEIPEK